MASHRRDCFAHHVLTRREALENVPCPERNRAWCCCHYNNAWYLLSDGYENASIEGEVLACFVELFKRIDTLFCNSFDERHGWEKVVPCDITRGTQVVLAQFHHQCLANGRKSIQLDLLKKLFVHQRKQQKIVAWCSNCPPPWKEDQYLHTMRRCVGRS